MNDKYPNTCKCGQPCYKGFTKIECSNMCCSHWDGNSLIGPSLSALPTTIPITWEGAGAEAFLEDRRKEFNKKLRESLASPDFNDMLYVPSSYSSLGTEAEKVWADASCKKQLDDFLSNET